MLSVDPYRSSSNYVSAVSTTIEKTRSTVAETDQQVISQKPNVDTVEISAQAKAVLAQATEDNAQKRVAVEATQSEEKAKALTAPVQAANVQQATASSVASEPVLASLSESQLDKLVSEGTITRQQADKELASRATEKVQTLEQVESKEGFVVLDPQKADSSNKQSKYYQQAVQAYAQTAGYSGGIAESTVANVA